MCGLVGNKVQFLGQVSLDTIYAIILLLIIEVAKPFLCLVFGVVALVVSYVLPQGGVQLRFFGWWHTHVYKACQRRFSWFCIVIYLRNVPHILCGMERQTKIFPPLKNALLFDSHLTMAYFAHT